jgi:hypothetical protein
LSPSDIVRLTSARVVALSIANSPNDTTS